MRIFLLAVLLCIGSAISDTLHSSGLLMTFGPELSFGGGEGCCRWGLEMGLWNVDNFPVGVDFGISTHNGKHLMWSEVQTGIGVAGVSAGAAHDFSTGDWGPQVSVWGGLFGYLGYRYRSLEGWSSSQNGFLQFKIPYDGDSQYSLEDDSDDADDWD